MLSIQTRFAIDSNHNRRVDSDEITRSFAELSPLDQDHNDVLRGSELDDLYFEYGQDDWLPAGRRTLREQDGFRISIEVEEVRLNPPGMDLRIQMT